MKNNRSQRRKIFLIIFTVFCFIWCTDYENSNKKIFIHLKIMTLATHSGVMRFVIKSKVIRMVVLVNYSFFFYSLNNLLLQCLTSVLFIHILKWLIVVVETLLMRFVIPCVYLNSFITEFM